jgi:hypothetical protein
MKSRYGKHSATSLTLPGRKSQSTGDDQYIKPESTLLLAAARCTGANVHKIGGLAQNYVICCYLNNKKKAEQAKHELCAALISQPDRINKLLCTFIICLFLATAAMTQQFDAPEPQKGNIIGTVTDVNNDTVFGARVVLEGPVARDYHTVPAIASAPGPAYSY